MPWQPTAYFLGLDLGQSQDYTALIIAEQQGPAGQAVYHLRHLERCPLGTSYPEVVRLVARRLHALPPVPRRLVVDKTGVGAAVCNMLFQAGLRFVGVNIHGGETVSRAVTREGEGYRVPKRDLVAVVKVMLQQQRLKIAQSLPLAPTLVQELLTFRVTIDPATAHDSYSAWREGGMMIWS